MIFKYKQQNLFAGFTLVELIITVVVLGIAITGIAGLYYSSQYTQLSSQYKDTATRNAQKEIEVLRNNTYNQLTAGDNIDFTSSLKGNLPGDKKGTVVVSEPTNGIKRVNVTVSYTNAGQAQKVTLSSLIGVIGIAQ